MSGRSKSLREELIAKGWRYWFRVAIVATFGLLLGRQMHEYHIWPDLHYAIYRVLLGTNWLYFKPSRTVVVEIDDEEYWKGPLARRVPLKRDYLARLVSALDKANPAAIAIDVQLRSPTVEGQPVESKDYENETQQFLETVKKVGSTRPVVLTSALAPDLTPESSVYRDFDFGTSRIFKGYLELPYDLRNLPIAIAQKDKTKLDSFSGAIVRAVGDPDGISVEDNEGERLPLGGYFKPKDFLHVSAGDVLRGDLASLQLLEHKIAIVGATWHQFAYNRGPLADSHSCPLGFVPGVYVHTNYVESILGHRVYQPLPETLAVIVEFLAVLILAVVFALPYPGLAKILSLSAASLMLLIVAYFFFQNFGLFFDFFIPLILVLAHGLLDEIRDWRSLAVKYEQLIHSSADGAKVT